MKNYEAKLKIINRRLEQARPTRAALAAPTMTKEELRAAHISLLNRVIARLKSIEDYPAVAIFEGQLARFQSDENLINPFGIVRSQ